MVFWRCFWMEVVRVFCWTLMVPPPVLLTSAVMSARTLRGAISEKEIINEIFVTIYDVTRVLDCLLFVLLNDGCHPVVLHVGDMVVASLVPPDQKLSATFLHSEGSSTAPLQCMLVHSTTLCSTTLNNTALHSTALHLLLGSLLLIHLHLVFKFPSP